MAALAGSGRCPVGASFRGTVRTLTSLTGLCAGSARPDAAPGAGSLRPAEGGHPLAGCMPSVMPTVASGAVPLAGICVTLRPTAPARFANLTSGELLWRACEWKIFCSKPPALHAAYAGSLSVSMSVSRFRPTAAAALSDCCGGCAASTLTVGVKGSQTHLRPRCGSGCGPLCAARLPAGPLAQNVAAHAQWRRPPQPEAPRVQHPLRAVVLRHHDDRRGTRRAVVAQTSRRRRQRHRQPDRLLHCGGVAAALILLAICPRPGQRRRRHRNRPRKRRRLPNLVPDVTAPAAGRHCPACAGCRHDHLTSLLQVTTARLIVMRLRRVDGAHTLLWPMSTSSTGSHCKLDCRSRAHLRRNNDHEDRTQAAGWACCTTKCRPTGALSWASAKLLRPPPRSPGIAYVSRIGAFAPRVPSVPCLPAEGPTVPRCDACVKGRA